MLLPAQRGRQGFSTGPVQFEVGGFQPALLQTLELEVDGEAQGLLQLGHLGSWIAPRVLCQVSPRSARSTLLDWGS